MRSLKTGIGMLLFTRQSFESVSLYDLIICLVLRLSYFFVGIMSLPLYIYWVLSSFDVSLELKKVFMTRRLKLSYQRQLKCVHLEDQFRT